MYCQYYVYFYYCMCTGRSILCTAITLCQSSRIVCTGRTGFSSSGLSWPSGCPPNRQRLQSILDLKRSRFLVGPTTFRSHHIPRSWITFDLTFWLGCFLTAPCSRELNTGAPQSPTLLLHRRRGGQLQLEVLAVEHTSCALGGRMQKPRLLVAMAMRELREDRQLVGGGKKENCNV